MQVKLLFFITILIVLVALVSAHRGKESDSLKESDSNNASEQVELSFTLERESLDNKDHKKGQSKDENDLGHKKKSKGKNDVQTKETENEYENYGIESNSSFQEDDKKDEKEGKSRAKKGNKKDQKSNKKQESESTLTVTDEGNREDQDQSKLAIEQQGDETKTLKTPTREDNHGMGMTDASFGQNESKVGIPSYDSIPSLNGIPSKTAASSQPQGTSATVKVASSAAAYVSKPAATATVKTSLASTYKASTGMIISLTALAFYCQL